MERTNRWKEIPVSSKGLGPRHRGCKATIWETVMDVDRTWILSHYVPRIASHRTQEGWRDGRSQSGNEEKQRECWGTQSLETLRTTSRRTCSDGLGEHSLSGLYTQWGTGQRKDRTMKLHLECFPSGYLIIARLFWLLIGHNCDLDVIMHIAWVHFQYKTQQMSLIYTAWKSPCQLSGLWPMTTFCWLCQYSGYKQEMKGREGEGLQPLLSGSTSLWELFLVKIVIACLFVTVDENKEVILTIICVWCLWVTEHFICHWKSFDCFIEFISDFH